MELKARPFPQVLLDRGPQEQHLAASGTIREEAYVLIVGPAEVVLPTVAVGEDAIGPFALLTEGRVPLSGGLTVEVEAEDGLQAAVFVYRISPWAAHLPIIDSDQYTLLVPRDTLLSVYFRPDGTLENASTYQKFRDTPPARH